MTKSQTSSVFFVGTEKEVAHHASPFSTTLEIQIVPPETVADVARSGDVAIFYSEHFDRFRSSCQQLRRNQVATIYMIDGILEWRNAWVNREDEVACPYTMRPVLSHKVACIGDSQARILDSWGNSTKTEVVGIPRLDEVRPVQRNRKESDPIRILVMTAKTPGFTSEQIETTQQSLKDLKQWFEQSQINHPGKYEVVWRLTGQLNDALGLENRWHDFTGKELADQLLYVDAVITTPSTAMLEAMKFERPVALLDYHNCPHYVPACWTISTADQFDSVIEQLAHPSDTMMHFQKTILKDSLQSFESSTERMIQLVQKMASAAKQQIQAGEELKFSSPILDPPASLSGKFSHRQFYPSVTEFEISDLTMAQLELSHSRREIKHLHEVISQLKMELGQAHQIFEEIESHPIAGPIVRIRRKLLELISAIRKRKNKTDTTRSSQSNTQARITEN
ncbi:MAG: hypothetical protein AAF939_01515 [Planctomycetota bacterium]